MNSNNENEYQGSDDWQQQAQGSFQQPVSGQNFTHNMPQQPANRQNFNQSVQQSPVSQPEQNMQQPAWNNQIPNQSQQAFSEQGNTTNMQSNHVQQGTTHQTNEFVSSNVNRQQNYQGNRQAFQQSEMNQQFNQVPYQANENMNFQQYQTNMYEQSANVSQPTKLMAKKYSGLYLTTIILAGIGALYYLSMASYSDELRWIFDSTWFSNIAADIWTYATLSLITVGVLTFLGWRKENRWLILSALIMSAVAIYFYAYIGIATLVILIILFVSMTKDLKKRY